jgi:FkbM family methyltransferase
MREVDSLYGRIKILDPSRDIVSHHLEKFGEWTYFESNIFKHILAHDAKILDGGAHIGTFSLGLDNFLSAASFYIVEPNEEIKDVLLFNLGNLKSPFKFDGRVISSMNVDFVMEKSSNLGAVRFLTASDTLNSKKVSSVSLESLINEHGPFDLIKLDLEGSESDALSGLNVFEFGTKFLWVECNESHDSLSLLEQLLTFGKPIHYVAFSVFNNANYNSSNEEIFPGAFESGLLVGDLPESMFQVLDSNQYILTKVTSVPQLKQALWLTPRWALASWKSLSRLQLVAQAGRDLIGMEYGTFLLSPNESSKRHSPRLEILRLNKHELWSRMHLYRLLLQRDNLVKENLRIRRILVEQERVIQDLTETN